MSDASKSLCEMTRRQWHIQGQVQGVGFRPFVLRLARRHRLTGFIRNDTSGVTIESQGRAEQVDLFAQALQTQCPPLALIDKISSQTIRPRNDDRGFHIESSADEGEPHAAVTVG